MLDDYPDPEIDVPLLAEPSEFQAVLAGGCFWCTEAVYLELPGVVRVESGYAGGDASTAHYETVCQGNTGHAEAIRITYDPSIISYGQLLKVFFFVAHDPTTLNRQGNDEGTQYRSAIFYKDQDQHRIAVAYIHQLDRSGLFQSPIVTTLEPLTGFFLAEKYHQNFARRHPTHPYIQISAAPKIRKLKSLLNSVE